MATAEDLRRAREQSSIFAGLFDYIQANEQALAEEGRRSVLGGLLSKEPVAGIDTLRYEGLTPFLAGLFEPAARAIDAPRAAAEGLIPQEDTLNEALGLAGFTMGAGGTATRPDGSLGMGGRVKKPKPPTKEELDPYGYQKTKLRDYLSNTQLDLQAPQGLLSRIPRSWEDAVNMVAIPFYGDRSAGSRMLEGVEGNTLSSPVYLEGGVDFMRGPAAQRDRAIWASNSGITGSIMNAATRAALDNPDTPLLGITGSMAPDALDFATFTGATLAEMMPFAKVRKSDANAFDRVMRDNVDPEFPGVFSDKLRMWAETTSPEKRKSFIRLMDTKPMQDAGFPSPGIARYAVTDPTQRDVKAGRFGLGASFIDPQAQRLYNTPKGNQYRAQVPHSTYNTQITGDYFGSLPPVPQGLLFRDVYDAMEGGVTKSGQPFNEAHKTHAIKTKMPAQVITPEIVERIMQYLATVEE